MEYEDVKKKFMRSEDNYLAQRDAVKLMGERGEVKHIYQLKIEKEDDFKTNRGKNDLTYLQNQKLIDAKRTGTVTLEIAQDTNTRLFAQTEIMEGGINRV